MAEGILRSRITEWGLKPEIWKISSAGINAQDGYSPSVFSEDVMAERGIDISPHQARTASEEIISDHCLTLTMEKTHKSILAARFPHFSDRIHMLSEMTDQEFPVDDPFGQTLEDYRRTADVISRLIDAGKDRIMQASSSTL
jgi:protein-tyrosine-phosphatase